MEQIAAAGAKAVAFLRERLGPLSVDGKWFQDRLAELDNDKYAVREAAIRELEKVGLVCADSFLRR